MDPFIGAILLAWFLLRGPAEDAWYSVKRQESPRAKTRRELQERKGGSVTSKLAHATADRLADRIANPKEKTRGPLRTYLSHLWADALAARDEQLAQRAEDRRRTAAGDTGDTPDTPEGVHVDDNGQDSGQEQPRRKWWQWKQPKPQPDRNPKPKRLSRCGRSRNGSTSRRNPNRPRTTRTHPRTQPHGRGLTGTAPPSPSARRTWSTGCTPRGLAGRRPSPSRVPMSG
jgi:hypothetical protein